MTSKILRYSRFLMTVLKTADQTFTGTTIAADADLKFPAKISTKYWFKFRVYYDTPTGADIKYYVNGPASPTLVQILNRYMAPGAAAITEAAIITTFAWGPTVVTETSGTNGYIEIEGILHNGATAGTVAFWRAQNASSGTSTIRAMSFVDVRELL